MGGKVDNALNEARTLVLVVQVLLGFRLQAVFQSGFERLPATARDVHLVGLGLETVALALLLWPAARHRIVEEGWDTAGFHHFVTSVMTAALLPLALGLGLDVYLAFERVHGGPPAVVAGAGAALIALVAWYGIGALSGGRVWPRRKEDTMTAETDLDKRIQHVLTETRVVLPGVQALLGFQLATTFVDGFDRLPAGLKDVHLAALALLSVSVVLLMAAPAYHRIVEEGENTERFHRVASGLLLASMPPLAFAIAGEAYVVVMKVRDSTPVAAAFAGTTLLLCLGLWFGWTIYRRSRAGVGDGARPRPTA
jgi:hypothetical protein